MSAAESPAEILERLAAERQESPAPQLPPRRVPIAVTGGLQKPTASELQAFLFCFRRLEGTLLIHGDHAGVEHTCATRASGKGIPVQAFVAEWKRHGWRAGPLRNQELAVACAAVIAFPGGRETADLVARARHLNRPIHLIEDEFELLRLDIQRDHLGA